MRYDGWPRRLSLAPVIALLAGTLVACSDDDNGIFRSPQDKTTLPALSESVIFDEDGDLSAQIRRTTNGVPHITADTLESAGFGAGYVQAQDNVCIIADEILRARGERARFYGPGEGDVNIVSDFSYRALGLLEQAQARYPTLDSQARALMEGFAAGYNRYVLETAPADLPSKCAGQAWVRPITPQELFAYYNLAARYASGVQFATGATFLAVPPGESPVPNSIIPTISESGQDVSEPKRRIARMDLDNFKVNLQDLPMASNGWGLGREMTESGRGALLANPHFPYTGSRRFYQAHIRVPGVVDFNGAGLIGVPLPQIGFNEHLGWTHTVTTSQRFTLYQLQLKAGDNLTYVKDGEERPITERQIQIEVFDGDTQPTTLERTFYFSEYGPMLAADRVNPSLPAWGDVGADGTAVAYSYRDANATTADQDISLRLDMARAQNIEQFRSAFGECGTVFWVNTIYADDQGNALYLDASAVPNVSSETIAALEQDPLRWTVAANGLTILDGSTSRDDWVEGECDGRVPFADSPQLQRADFVQNSNDSYWATNPAAPLEGYSPLFGPTETELSARTRMGLAMLLEPTNPGLSSVPPAGADGKFSARDIMDALYSNRAYLAETLLDDLLERCLVVGSEPVSLGGSGRSVAEGCSALAAWDGVYDLDSRGAHTFRLFAHEYNTRLPDDYSVGFDPSDPLGTPADPQPMPVNPAEDPMLQSLAAALDILDSVNLAYDAALGEVQRQQLSVGVPPGETPAPAGAPIPWHGPQGVPEGGFNVVRGDPGSVDLDTRFPRVNPDSTLAAGLSPTPGEGWWISYGTSWHFGLEFTDEGPQAYGLLSYSQSSESDSPYFRDQDLRYSSKNYRKLLLDEDEIASDPNLTTETITSN